MNETAQIEGASNAIVRATRLPRPGRALPTHISPKLRAALTDAQERLRSAYGDRLRRVVLYGSRARGDAAPDSDVDVLVVLDRLTANRYQESKRAGGLWGNLFEKYRLFFSLHIYTEEEYQTQGGPFMRNVREEGIQLPERLT